MNGIKQIFGKEMARIFRDKKMIFSVFLLPVIIMIAILTIISSLASNMQKDIESHISQIYMINEPKAFQELVDSSGLKCKITSLPADGLEKAKREILDGEKDLIIEFPAEFEAKVSDYKKGDEAPQVKTYYNPSEEYSSAAYKNMNQTLESYRQALLAQRVDDLDELKIFSVNSDNKDMIIQDDNKASGKALGMMLPYFITILLFAGAMGIGTDMIAGEKERGTMASLLVSPVKRSSIALGKVFALMTLSGISSLIYVAAMVVCAPIMMESMMRGSKAGLNLSLSIQQIIMLGILLVAISFVYSSIIALTSVFAKSVKEASTYVMPVYMLVLVVGLLTMFTSGGPEQTSYFIPIYNNSLALQGILSQEVTMFQYGVTLAETLVIGIVLQIIIVRAFESEKVMSN